MTDETIIDVATMAETAIKGIPGWYTWTEAEALAWHDTNVQSVVDAIDTGTITNLATALPVIDSLLEVVQKLSVENRNLAKFVIAARNKLWPHLEGSNGQ